MPETKLTAREVDQALDNAETALAKLGTALFELDAERERASLDAAGLTGTSKTRWAEAVKRLDAAWSLFQTASETIAFARTQRSRTGRPRQQDLADLWQTLTDRSVDLPAGSTAIIKSVAPRNTAVAAPISVAEAASFISNLYQAAAETITSLVTIRNVVLPRLDELDALLAEGEERAESAGVDLTERIAASRSRVSALKAGTIDDPLSSDPDQIAGEAEEVENILRLLEQEEANAESASTACARIDAALERLDSVIAETTQAVAAAGEKIAGFQPRPVGPEALESSANGLRERAKALADRYPGDRRIPHAAVEQLETKIDEVESQAKMLAGSAKSALGSRRELRGRLDAYRAKANALGWAEDTSLQGLYTEAEDSLYTSPCDLEIAGERLAAYQSAISKLASGDET